MLLQKQGGNITYPGSTPPTLSWGGVQAAPSPLIEARVPVPVLAPQPLQPQTNATSLSQEMLQVILGNRDREPETQLLPETQTLQPQLTDSSPGWELSQVMPGTKG